MMYVPLPFYFALGCNIIDILELLHLMAPVNKNILIQEPSEVPLK